MSGEPRVMTTLNRPDTPSNDLALPAACAVAFKEWAGVCEALMAGRQSLILRKGGVAETAGEFRPDHAAFWLYPTIVHQAEQGLRTPTPDRTTSFNSQIVPIEALAVVEWTGRVETLDQLAALTPFHDWTESTIRGRFDYRKPGLWALVVRIYRREEPWPLAVTPEQLGCKTWVPLDSKILTDGVRAVMDPAEAESRRNAIRQVLGVPT